MSDVQLIQTPCVFGENGNFLLERELGRGGMGGVYLGRDKMLDRPVAVKVMLREFGSDAGFVERFKKEAQAAARLIHPNIAQVYSYGISDGMPYIAMELVAGGSLDQIMRNSGANSDIPRIMKICEQVAQALRCAADQGLVHGDIKPENILLDANGNAKIVDFGLAAMQHDTDEIWGTPYYIAPEKVRKDAVDYRADMYSLGGTLYHALCGAAPFEGEDAMTVVRKRFEFIPRKPSEIRPELSSQIDALVMRMLAFNPGDRYPSFEALLADFKAVMTVGLSSSQILSPQGAPAKSADAASSGKKKLMIKPKKKLSIKKPSGDDAGDQGDESENPNTGKTYNFKKMASGDDSDEESYEDEESEGNVGAKVAIFAGVLIGAVLLVGGGLWAIKSYSENKDKETQSAQVRDQIDEDVKYLKSFQEKSLKPYKDSVEKLLKEVSDETKASFDKYEEIYSGTEIVPFIKDIRLPKVQAAPAPETSAGAPAQNAAEGGNAEVKAEATPEKTENDAVNEQQAAATSGEAVAETPQVELPPSFEKMRELWGKMTSLKGEIEGLKKEIGDLESKINDRLSKISYDEAFKKDMMDFVQNEVKPHETSSKNKISQHRKACKSSINEMKKICDQDLKRRTEVKEKERREKEKQEKEERLQRLKAEKEAARKAVLERELEEAKTVFETVDVQERLRSLYWKGVLDELDKKIRSFETAEARVRVKEFAVKKVEMMHFVHKRFCKVAKDHVFNKNDFRIISDKDKSIDYVKNFANKRVVRVDEEKIVLLNKDGKGKESPYGWRTIYDRYPFIMSLLINKAEKGLSSNEMAEYKLGLAMILKTFCLSVEGVDAYYRKCVEEAVTANSYYKPLAEESFPEIDLSKIEAKKAENDL